MTPPTTNEAEKTDAQLAEQLRVILKEDAARYQHARLPTHIRDAIDRAAQRLERENGEATFMRALEAYGEIWTRRKDHQKALRAALTAAFSGEKDADRNNG